MPIHVPLIISKENSLLLKFYFRYFRGEGKRENGQIIADQNYFRFGVRVSGRATPSLADHRSLVDETHIRADAQHPGHFDETLSVHFTFVAFDLGVGRAQWH